MPIRQNLEPELKWPDRIHQGFCVSVLGATNRYILADLLKYFFQ